MVEQRFLRSDVHDVHGVEDLLVKGGFVLPFEIMTKGDVDIVDTACFQFHADVGMGADAGVDVVFFVKFGVIPAAHEGDGGAPDVALFIEFRAWQHVDDGADLVAIAGRALPDDLELTLHEAQALRGDLFVDVRVVFLGEHVLIFRAAAQEAAFGGRGHDVELAVQGKIIPAWPADDDPIAVHDGMQAEAVKGMAEHEFHVLVGLDPWKDFSIILLRCF